MFSWFRKHDTTKFVSGAEAFIEKNYEAPPPPVRFSKKISVDPTPASGSDVRLQLADYYDDDFIDQTLRGPSSPEVLRALDGHTDMTFVDKLLEHIRKRDLPNFKVYKAAQLDRRLFSKIISNRCYTPNKDTCVALALALRLSLSQTSDLLARAGFVLSHSNKRDIVIEYFFREHIYNLSDINEILFQLGMRPIGR